jgi:hypothetical protein
MLLTWTFTGLEPELRKNTLGVLRTLDSCRKVLIESIESNLVHLTDSDWLRWVSIGCELGYRLIDSGHWSQGLPILFTEDLERQPFDPGHHLRPGLLVTTK